MSTGRRGVRVPFWMGCVSTFSAHTSVAVVASLNHLTVGTGSSCQFFAQCAHTCLAASPLEQVSGPSETEQRARERLAQSATRPPGHGQAGFAVPWSPSACSGSPAHPCWGLDVLTGSREPPALNLCGWRWWGRSTAQLWRASSRYLNSITWQGIPFTESSGWRWQDTSSPSTGLVEAPQVRWGHEEVTTGRAGQPDGGERRSASFSVTTLPSQGASLVPAPSAEQGTSLFSPWQAP